MARIICHKREGEEGKCNLGRDRKRPEKIMFFLFFSVLLVVLGGEERERSGEVSLNPKSSRGVEGGQCRKLPPAPVPQKKKCRNSREKNILGFDFLVPIPTKTYAIIGGPKYSIPKSFSSFFWSHL